MSQSLNPKKQIQNETIFNSPYCQTPKVAITFPSDSPYTKQSFKDECDINTIMSQYQFTGELPNLNERAPQYLDATNFDFAEAMNEIAEAQSLFQDLPSAIRNKFENSPAKFLEFCSQEKNRPELDEMGLLRPLEERTVPYPIPDPSKAPSASPNASITPNPHPSSP